MWPTAGVGSPKARGQVDALSGRLCGAGRSPPVTEIQGMEHLVEHRRLNNEVLARCCALRHTGRRRGGTSTPSRTKCSGCRRKGGGLGVDQEGHLLAQERRGPRRTRGHPHGGGRQKHSGHQRPQTSGGTTTGMKRGELCYRCSTGALEVTGYKGRPRR